MKIKFSRRADNMNVSVITFISTIDAHTIIRFSILFYFILVVWIMKILCFFEE